MATYKPWRDKAYLHQKYVTERKTLAQIVADCKEAGYEVTEMTIYNNLKSNNIPIRGGSRNLGSRSVGGNGTKRKGFYG
jgi:hypothetical protein